MNYCPYKYRFTIMNEILQFGFILLIRVKPFWKLDSNKRSLEIPLEPGFLIRNPGFRKSNKSNILSLL